MPEAVVYFISDLDPSGLDLQRAREEALGNFGVRVAHFVRIGLTLRCSSRVVGSMADRP